MEIILTVFAGEPENVIQHKWGGDDGWTAVKFKPVNFIEISAAPQLIALLDDFNVVAVDGQPAGYAQPSETAPDDNDFPLRRALPTMVLRFCRAKYLLSYSTVIRTGNLVFFLLIL